MSRIGAYSDCVRFLVGGVRLPAPLLVVLFASLLITSIGADVLNVGYGQKYESITVALGDAQSGDEILLHPNYTPQTVRISFPFISRIFKHKCRARIYDGS
jgi:hypothetical protein